MLRTRYAPIAVTDERFYINHVALATPALICLVTLTFDILTLKVKLVNIKGDIT